MTDLNLGLIYAYNHMLRNTNLERDGWSEKDVKLKRRHDLIPSLVQIIAGDEGFENKPREEVSY